MDEFRIRAPKMTNYMKEAFSASECALSKNPTIERPPARGACTHRLWLANARAGLRAPCAPACWARGGSHAPERMPSGAAHARFARTGAHAVRRSARAGAGASLFGQLAPNGTLLPLMPGRSGADDAEMCWSECSWHKEPSANHSPFVPAPIQPAQRRGAIRCAERG
jgi:hypothetical protein